MCATGFLIVFYAVVLCTAFVVLRAIWRVIVLRITDLCSEPESEEAPVVDDRRTAGQRRSDERQWPRS